MNYDFYKTFVVLAETKNFSKTAEKLNIVQSTVSNRIQELEKYLGVNLFSRNNKSVALTQAGTYFINYAKRMVAIEEESITMLNSLRYRDTLRIGTVHSLYSGYIKKAAKKFMKLNPDVSLEVIINHTPNILELLSDNLIDVAFVFTLPKSNKMTCYKVLKDEIILVTQNSKECKDEIFIEDLKDMTLLYADTGESFIKYVEEQIHNRLDFQLSIDQISEVVEYLCEGFGYSFVLKSMVVSYIESGVLKEVKIKNAPIWSVEGYIVFESSSIKKVLIDTFIKLL
ncbi:LysR family transcriptional regulator [Clostridium sp. 19966]|uniref:LysR family transcriptional regulator n=1 Tax=Clostridium sp. 19966 TaxID=2768166 RepID=UPI0028E046BC|nr:LysR family transcriptional regulator [Clostridium sp. 19966]MDT8717712.1 LysR family transcriptional regulator [Clostridium sp. 19966]